MIKRNQITRLFILSFLIINLLACSKDNEVTPPEENQEEQIDPEEESEEEETPPTLGEVSASNSVTIEVDIPANTTFADFYVEDISGNRVDLNNSKKVNIGESGLFQMKNKITEELIHIGYFSTNASGTNSKTKPKELSKANHGANFNQNWTQNVLGSTSSAIFAVSSQLDGQLRSFMDLSTSGSNNALFNLYELGLQSELIDYEDVKEVSELIDGVLEAGETLTEAFRDSAIKAAIEKVTGGLFTDCPEKWVEAVNTGQVQMQVHPDQEQLESEILYAPENNLPYIHPDNKFINTKANGVLITNHEMDAENNTWKLKLSAYNGLPVALGVSVGKLREGSQFAGETLREKPDYILHPNGNAIIEVFRNGISCEGFTTNFFDIIAGRDGLKAQDYTRLPIELEMSETNNRIIFETPKDDIYVRTYNYIFLGSSQLSFLFEALNFSGHPEGIDVGMSILFTRLTTKLLENQEVLNAVAGSSVGSKEVIKVVTDEVAELGVEVIEELVNISNAELNSFLDGVIMSFDNSKFSAGVKAYKIALNAIDAGTFANGINNVGNFFAYDYELVIPSLLPEVQPAKNPTPTNQATDVPLSGQFSFEPGENSPENAHYFLFLSKEENPSTLYADGEGQTSFDYENLEPNTTYYWKVETSDIGADMVLATSPIWSFTTTSAQSNVEPPNTPSPEDMATNVPLEGSLSFSPGENTPAEATFKLFLGTDPNPTDFVELGSQTSFAYTDLQEQTTYYWYVQTLDAAGAILVQSPVWSFGTVSATSGECKISDEVFVLTNQEEVDAFVAENYCEVAGLTISGSTITNLSGLLSLKEVSVRLTIDGLKRISNLSFLSNLKYCPRLFIENTELTDIQGLNNLEGITHFKFNNNQYVQEISTLSDSFSKERVFQIEIQSNEGLLTLSNFANEMTIGGVLYIKSNPNLESITGFSSLEKLDIGASSTRRCLEIENNQNLKIIDFPNLSEVLGPFNIRNNPQVENLNGFSSLNKVGVGRGDVLSIREMNGLKNLQGIEGLTGSLVDLTIMNNENLESLLGLHNVENISFDLEIKYNPSLSSLNGMNNLVGIGRRLDIDTNYSLLNLEGLNNVSSIGSGGIRIQNNSKLENLDALRNLSSSCVGGLGISNNPSLQNLDGLTGITKTTGIRIEDNSSLENIEGLQNITELSCSFNSLINSSGMIIRINRNSSLNSLSGLQSLEVMGGSIIEVLENGLLSDFCALQTLFLNNPEKEFDYNPTGNLNNPTREEVENGDCD